jgi:hypothetical protein
MRLKFIIPVLVVAAVGLNMACPPKFVEVQSHDGYKLSFPQRDSDAELAEQLRVHDKIADTVLAAKDPRGAATTLRGPEGLTFVYGPGSTREIFMPDLRTMYGPEMAERVASGDFLRSPGPDERRLFFLMAVLGMSAETARMIIEASREQLHCSDVHLQQSLRRCLARNGDRASGAHQNVCAADEADGR